MPHTFKTPYRDGTTHVIFEPLDFIARLVALVPRPRVLLTRYHGVFAPHSAWRPQITPTGRGSGKPAAAQRILGKSLLSLAVICNLYGYSRLMISDFRHKGLGRFH